MLREEWSGTVQEHSRTIDGLREVITQLQQRMDRRFEALERRLDALDQKLDQRTDVLDQKMSRQFMWVVGVQVTTLAAIVGALLAR